MPRPRTIAPMTNSRQDAVCLWLVLVLPSSFVVHKYLGWEGTIIYSIGVAASVALGRRGFTRLSTRTLAWLVLLASVLIAVAFVVVYPIANTHAAGAGSDDDDALNLGAMALLAGRFPYAETTYLGNVLHHLPGAFILATPFVALGTSALQNLWWLPVFFLAVKEEANGRTALELALVVVALSPEVVYEVVTGTGYLANAISVLLGLWWLVRTTPSGRRRHRLGAHTGVTRQLPLPRAAGGGLPVSTLRVENRGAGDGAHLRDGCGADVAVLFPRSTQLWAAGRCEPPGRLQPASSTSRNCADRPDGGPCGRPLVAADGSGGTILELHGRPGVSGDRRCCARLRTGSTDESLVRALRCVLRVVRAHGIGGGTVQYAAAAHRGRCTSSIFVPAGPSTYAN